MLYCMYEHLNNRPISRKEWLHLQPALMESTVFPLPFQSHLIFCVIATIFFVIQFIRMRRMYQLVFAVAVPATLLLYICLLYTSPSPRDNGRSRMPSSA